MKAQKFALKEFLPDIIPAAAIVTLQAVACLFFVADALADDSEPASGGSGNALEIGVSFALLAGTIFGAAYLYRLVREIRVRAAVVAIARGALSRMIADRFSQWQLSTAESDVALFALKGCTVREIAEMRSAAQGTIRAQLSQVYAKAGVSSQPMLMSLFLEDLMCEDSAFPVP